MLITLSLLLPCSLCRVFLSLVPNQLHVIVYSKLLEIDVHYHAWRYPSSHLTHRYILLEVLSLPRLLRSFKFLEVRIALCGLRICPVLPLAMSHLGQVLGNKVIGLFGYLDLGHDPGCLLSLDPLAIQVLRKPGNFALKSASVSLLLCELLLD